MMHTLPAGPLVQAIGWALLHLVWIGTLIAMALALLLAFVPGRSQLRYALSCIALALIVALGIVAGIRSYRTEPISTGSIGNVTIVAFPPAATPPAIGPARSERMRAWVARADEALPLVVLLWFSGVFLGSTRLLIEWLRIRRLMSRQLPPAPAPWPTVARRLSCALGLTQAVRVLLSAAVEVPSVIGLVRPVILIPASSLAGLTPAQLEMILAHELAHVRRHDFLVNVLQTIVETLLFYHPAVWWVSRQIRTERESCCDDLAVGACGDRVQYARALLRLEEIRAERLTLAMSADGGSLMERVRRLVPGSTHTTGSAVRAAGALAIPMFLLLGVALPAISSMKRAETVRPAISEASTGAVSALIYDEGRMVTPAAPVRRTAAPTGPKVESAKDTKHEVKAKGLPKAESLDEQTEAEPEGLLSEVTDNNRPTLDELIGLRAQGVTRSYIHDMRSLLGRVSVSEITSLKAVGVTPEYILEMRHAGLSVKTPGDASGLVALGVESAFVREMRSIGFPVTTAEEAKSLKAVGVNAADVRAFRSRGLTLTAEEAQSFAALDVTPEYADAMKSAGVKITGAGDLQSLRALGITPEFVQALAKAGYRNLSVEKLQRFGAAGLNGDFIREMSQYRTH